MQRMVTLSATQNLTPRHTLRYGQACPLPEECRSHCAKAVSWEEAHEEDSWSGREEYFLSMRVDGDLAVWVYHRKSRCRPGLERNSGRHSRRERPETVRPGAICSDCAARRL